MLVSSHKEAIVLLCEKN